MVQKFVKVDEDVHKALKLVCVQEGISMADKVRALVGVKRTENPQKSMNKGD